MRVPSWKMNKINAYFQAAEIDRLQNDSSQWDSSSIAALSSQLAEKKKITDDAATEIVNWLQGLLMRRQSCWSKYFWCLPTQEPGRR